jgi:glycosyltransferase involved in cell wall biosynthesis
VRTLESLAWARRIVVVDSGSTDETLNLISGFPQAEVFHRQFDDPASQCNFGLSQIESEWVLSLDADYVLSRNLVNELRQLQDDKDANGYSASFVYKVFGKSLRAALDPPRTVL